MNRGYSYNPRGGARGPPHRDRLRTQDSSRTSRLRHQAPVKQDINIDDFGDMDSDEDDFQASVSSFTPAKPPAQPQYNLVPYGFLRDDDELVEEDYDGVPIDDTALQDSSKNQLWKSSPRKPQSEEARGAPIAVLGSDNFGGSHFRWQNDNVSRDAAAQNRPGLGSSSDSRSGRWDKKGEPFSIMNPDTINIASLAGINRSVGKEQNFVRGNDGGSPFLKTSNKPASSKTLGFVRSTDDRNPFIKGASEQNLSGNATSFVSARDTSTSSFRSNDNALHWNDKTKSVQSRSSAWAEQPSLKGHVRPGENPILTPTSVANTSSQLEIMQAAALQQALTGLTQLGSQSGLNLLGAQNLLMQASRNPTLAAALVASGGMINTGLSSIQPNSLNDPTIEPLLKSTVTAPMPDISQSKVGLLSYPLRSNIKGNSDAALHKKSIPDGSGSTRYPAPDVSSLVFDPSTGYRFDASTGLHYDANSGYFFNSELKIYLQWDKFTQTYLKVDNPPGVPRFNDSSTERMSYIKNSSLSAQEKLQPSSFSSAPFLAESTRYSNALPTSNFVNESRQGLPTSRGIDVPTSSFQKAPLSVHPPMSTIPSDFSKPPPPLPHSLYSGSGFQHTKPLSSAEQKAAVLPNYAETSLFNKLRKAKLAQTAQSKSDRKQWGSPDPLLEAVQKQAAQDADTNESQGGVVNLKEILQRSRQFMKQKTVNLSDSGEGSIDRHARKCRNHSSDRRKLRSRSRSVGRPFRRSRSSERPGNRRGRSSMSPQQRKPPARNPEIRTHCRTDSRGRSPSGRGRKQPSPSLAGNRMPASRSRSPHNRARDRASLSPARRRRKSASKGRSPFNRAGVRASPLPEARNRRPPSKGRSPHRRKGKSSKSPDARQGGPVSRGRSPERRSHGRRSISQELRKRRHHSHTPDKNLLKRSPSPVVKVVLNKSPGGSKARVRSPGRINKRSAERGLSTDRSRVRRKLSPVILSAYSPERTKASTDDRTGLVGQNTVRERIGIHQNRSGSLEKDRITELKPLPYSTPQGSGRKSSGRGKDVSGYKSLSNLRNQGNGKPRQKESVRKQDNSQQIKAKPITSRPTIEVDLTVDSDNEKQSRENRENSVTMNSRLSSKVDLMLESVNEKQSRANHRLVSERTFSRDSERKMPDSVSQKLLSKKTDAEAESHLSVNDAQCAIDYEDTNQKDGTEEVKQQFEEPSEFDFLTETLDDDKESTVIDEYEEILDYQDLDEAAELAEKEVASTQTKPDILEAEESVSKESVGSPAIDLCIGPEDPAIQSESVLESKPCSSSEEAGVQSGKSDSLGAVNAPAAYAVVSELIGKGVDEILKVCEEGSSSKSDDLPTVQGETSEVRIHTEKEDVDSNAGNKAAAEMELSLDDGVDGSGSNKYAPEELGPEVMDDEEWNVVDSVDDQEEMAKQPVSTDVIAFLLDGEQDSPKLVPSEATVSPVIAENSIGTKIQNEALGSHMKEDQQDLQASAVDTKNTTIDSLVVKIDGNEEKPGAEVSKEDERNGEPLQSSIDLCKNVILQSETEEPVVQVRSVSDIEKFLLLSSQEVEAKREQGIDSITSKNDKKAGVFSRLGEKLPTEEAGGEPKVVLELPAEPSVSPAGPSENVSASTLSEGKPGVAKSSGASKAPKKSKKTIPERPLEKLFHNEPTSQVMIAPMNFIEPLQNFQHFTQKYMQRMLQEEGVKFRQVYVCHEDVTGAPYHYILVMFHSIKLASVWFKKHKGKFKCDEKLFTQIPGHTKQKLIPGAEAFLYFTDNNWVCKVCRKGNFPPRSLCFGCFQHRDPTGFSPVTILDKGPPPYKHSNFVGTPKLKFFVTKEKVIESAPPLDGFDIKNIEMIMDEDMGFPAGICVFEMYNYVDAGKLKKYLNRRDIEAVSVEMHTNSNPSTVKSRPRSGPSRKTPPKEFSNDRPCKSLQGVSVPESNAQGCSGGYEGIRGTLELSPRMPPEEVRFSRVCSPSPTRVLILSPARKVRVSGGRSPTPPREVRVPRQRSPTPPREVVRVPRRRSPTPPREVRVLSGRSPTPSREVRVPRRRSPTPPREVRVPRRRSPTPPREVRVLRGRSPTPSREVRVPRQSSPTLTREVRVSKERSSSLSSRQTRVPRRRSPSPLPRRISTDRVQNRSPRRHSPGHRPRSRSPRHNSKAYEEEPYPPTGSRSVREISRGRAVRESPSRYHSRERSSGYQSPVPPRSSGYQSSPRYHSRSPVYDTPRHRSPSPRYRSQSPVRPTKPDGRGDWRYPPPDPTNFRFEPRSGLDYDSTTTLYYEPKSCCFYNDDTNEWLEYEPKTGRYVLVR